jgi:hypothetical protein
MDMPYPFFQVQASGPNETGFAVTLHIEDGAGGPLAGLDDGAVVDALRDLFGAQDGTVVTATRTDITDTNL